MFDGVIRKLAYPGIPYHVPTRLMLKLVPMLPLLTATLRNAQITAGPALSALNAVCAISRSAGTAGKPLQLTQLFTHQDPLVVATSICLFWVAACWIWSLLTDNYSHVDRLWSILPVFYVAAFARDELYYVYALLYGKALQLAHRQGFLQGMQAPSLDPDLVDVRLAVQLLLVTIWGSRLTYNFWRKGGYSYRFEDYRWAVVRTLFPNKLVHEIFNLVFVAFAQHVLCLFITCPAHFTFLAKHAHKHPLDPSLDSTADVLSLDHGRRKMVWLMKPLQPTTKPWGALDTAAVCVYLFGLFLEAAADQQQWSFQRKKHALIFGRKPREGDFARGFLTSGLFRLSRHPNFFGEMTVWWGMALFIPATWPGVWLSWPLMGPLGLSILLLTGSPWITEKISKSRYPDYAAYQHSTSCVIPWLPGKPLPDKKTH